MRDDREMQEHYRNGGSRMTKTNLVNFPSAIPPHFASGRVEGTGGVLRIRTSESAFEARRAKSCLVEPELGDRVLCAIDGRSAYVLAVLDGADGSTRIATDGDLELVAKGGRATLCAADGVDLASPRAISVTAGELRMRAAAATVAFDELGYLGKLVRAEIAKVTTFAQELELVATRVAQRAKRCFRFVEDLDQTRAGTLDMRAEGTASVRAENALVSARVLAKVDAEQIHLG